MPAYTKLGPNGPHISRICLGTMTWGHQNSEADAHAQMDYALGEGINFWDTAELYAVPPSAATYTKTETYIGNWFAKTGKRKDVVLASKVAGPGRPYIRGGAGFSREGIRTALEASLTRLQTDYLDLYQLHWPNRGSYHFSGYWGYAPAPAGETTRIVDDMLETLQTLADCVKEGKVRSLGLSNETAWGVMQYQRLAEIHELPRFVSIQNEYSLLCRKFEPELQEVALREGIGLLAWSPLATGILSGKYLGSKLPEGTRLALPENGADWRLNAPHTEAATKAYVELARKHGLDPNQMAIAFVLSRPFVTSCIIGATNLDQLKANIAADGLVLDAEVLAGIEGIRRAYPLPF